MSIFSKLFSTKARDNTNKSSQSEINAEKKEAVLHEIDSLKNKLKNKSTLEKSGILNEIGEKYQSLGEDDKAISAFEKSLETVEDFGPAFDALLTLYDKKRKEAAYRKDNDEIQKWLNKSDQLTALSKKIMRTK